MNFLALDEKVAKVFATKYGYLPGNVKQLSSFVKVIHNFATYLGNNKYYSETVNKRIALLALDSDILALKAEKARLQAENFYSRVELALFTKAKPDLDKKEVEKFKQDLKTLMEECMKVNDRALSLMEEIKREYGSA